MNSTKIRPESDILSYLRANPAARVIDVAADLNVSTKRVVAVMREAGCVSVLNAKIALRREAILLWMDNHERPCTAAQVGHPLACNMPARQARADLVAMATEAVPRVVRCFDSAGRKCWRLT